MLGYSPNTVRKYVQAHYEIHTQNIVTSVKTDDDRLIGTYIGLWMGDGTQYIDDGNYAIKICLDARNQELINFVKWVFVELFDANICELRNPGTNSYYVKTYSKFIYEFVNTYCTYSAYKTESVQLRDPVSTYSRPFIHGCVLGLMLSDGYLGQRVSFNVTSKGLARNMYELLECLGFHPNKYIQLRPNPRWNDLIHTVLYKDEAKLLEKELDRTVQKLVGDKTFFDLKYVYENNDPPRI